MSNSLPYTLNSLGKKLKNEPCPQVKSKIKSCLLGFNIFTKYCANSGGVKNCPFSTSCFALVKE